MLYMIFIIFLKCMIIAVEQLGVSVPIIIGSQALVYILA
jgi:hypothetical protein